MKTIIGFDSLKEEFFKFKLKHREPPYPKKATRVLCGSAKPITSLALLKKELRAQVRRGELAEQLLHRIPDGVYIGIVIAELDIINSSTDDPIIDIIDCSEISSGPKKSIIRYIKEYGRIAIYYTYTVYDDQGNLLHRKSTHKKAFEFKLK